MGKKQFSYNKAFTNTDWDSTQVYNPDIINQVVDPGGGTNTSPANAIPSPFARIDLVRTAFRSASESGTDFSGLTHHDFKLISDAWDVGELFFRRKELFETTANVRIIEWDTATQVNGLINSENKGHRKLGKALQLFFNQDKEGFNFDGQKQYYLFQRNFKTYGGTSPLTLFFSSADPLPTDVSYLGDVFFDEGTTNWKHLHQRGDDFQEFIHLLFEAGNFRSSMSAMDKYLTKSFNLLQSSKPGLYQRIGSIRQFGTPLPVTGTADISKHQLADSFLRENYHLQTEGQHQVKILGYPLYTTKELLEVKSDFFIESEKSSMKVLVPLNEDASLNVSEKGLTYYGGLWDEKYRKEVPFKGTESWKERDIPAAFGKKGAVLLVGDLLEDVILKVSYPIDKKHYFSLYSDAGVTKKHDYLLPLKKEFFDFFDHSQLAKTIDGKKTIELEEIGSAVKIYLRIPIKSNISNRHIGHVEFTKIYSKQVDSERNKGMILEDQTGFGFEIGMAMTPPVRWNVRPDYRIHLMDINTEKFIGKVELSFYSNSDDKITEVRSSERRNKQNGSQSSVFYNVKGGFDWINVNYEFQNTIREAKIVPLWADVNSNVKYDVSVDFGTTNTHIEMRQQNSVNSSGFETEKSNVISTLFDTSGGDVVLNLVELMNQEFVPKLISDTYRFPKRTVISHSKSYTIGGHVNSFALGDYNYPLVYEIKELPSRFTEVHTDLKWSMEHGTARLLDGFIENIALLIRSKILSDGGDPKQTAFFITHPTSMTASRVTMIEKAWENQMQNLYGITDVENHLTTLTESLAPYVYYSKTNAVAAYDRPVVSIDIGGGTTDIIVVDKKVPSIVSSLRFAGNSLFGDGYNSSTNANGFINRYLNGFGNKLGYKDQIQNTSVNKVYAQLQTKSSADIISFLFSLKDSKDLASRNISIDFARDLSEDKNLRTVFVIFYSSIIFHVARQMKAKGLRPPADVLFSGTGSRILFLLDSSSDNRHLSLLTKEILKQVYTEDIADTIKIRMDRKPKELTAKGAILFEKDDFIQQFVKDDPDLNSVHAIMQRLTQTYVGQKNGEVKLGADYDYETVVEGDYANYVKAEFEEFIASMERVYERKTMIDQFDVQASDWREAINILQENFVNGLREGMEHKLKEVNDKKSHLNESPFFYPLHYSLCLIADKLVTE